MTRSAFTLREASCSPHCACCVPGLAEYRTPAAAGMDGAASLAGWPGGARAKTERRACARATAARPPARLLHHVAAGNFGQFEDLLGQGLTLSQQGDCSCIRVPPCRPASTT